MTYLEFLAEKFLGPIRSKLDNIERLLIAMADQSALLNSIAEGLRALGASVSALLAENATLRTRNAELEGEEVAESAATTSVKAEFDAVAGLFTAEPTVPDVPPLEPPVEPTPEG